MAVTSDSLVDIRQFLPAVPLIMLYKVVLTFESVDEITELEL